MGKDVEIVTTASDQEAVIVRQGQILYCAACLDAEAYKVVFKKLCKELQIPHVDLPDGVKVRQLGDRMIAINYSATAQDLSALKPLFHFEHDSMSAANVAFGSIAVRH
ncbi:hypothetical protein [Thiolinea disciformis]|uniref:hypothetical protein n=1 Tax=Thiolinea disciformis TaxID=125614 RepID=UPI0003810668|nr:hypothetical protein [Thiolinea disciformis]